MPILEVNAAGLWLETFGDLQPGQPPLLLIHRAPSTGRNDWGAVAPRLAAAGHAVLVPDCRGHGRSANPGRSYAFAEVAFDMAALLHALGCDRAHVVGHSNGGNVALRVLMEQPEFVQTCVLQAANAY